MNILAIDYGQKRIGLAIAKGGLSFALPFGVVTKDPSEVVPEKLLKCIEEQNIDTIVIGLPLGMNGEENKNTIRIRAFQKEIADKTSITPIFVDERFTTHEASRMEDGGASLDEKSAMIILEEFLASS